MIAPPMVTKWSGVLAYCHNRGIAPSDVLAVGDGDMLNRAGIGVSVRGGTKRAATAADSLIEPPQNNGWTAIVTLI